MDSSNNEKNIEIIFNKLTTEDVISKNYLEKALVFNIILEDLLSLEVIENKFSDTYGNCSEKVDMFLVSGDSIANLVTYFDYKDYFTEKTDSGSGVFKLGEMVNKLIYDGIKFDGVLVVTRTLSSYLLDRNSDNINLKYYHVCPTEARDLISIPAVSGLLATKNIKLDNNFKQQIIDLADLSMLDHQITINTYKKIMNILNNIR